MNHHASGLTATVLSIFSILEFWNFLVSPSPQRQKFGPQTPIEVQNLPKGIDLVKKDYFYDPPSLLGPGPSILGALPLQGPWQGGILAGKVARVLPGSLEISYARWW